jgi:hypothetical protein
LRLFDPDAALQFIPGADDVPDAVGQRLRLRRNDDTDLSAADLHDAECRADAGDHAAHARSEYRDVLRAAAERVPAAGATGVLRADAVLSWRIVVAELARVRVSHRVPSRSLATSATELLKLAVSRPAV